MDYEDLMQAARAEDEPAVAKILDKLTDEELKTFYQQLHSLAYVTRATRFARDNNRLTPCVGDHCWLCGTE